MLRLSTAIVTLALVSFGAAAQTNTQTPDTRSNSPDAGSGNPRANNGVFNSAPKAAPGPSISNSNDSCAQWHLSSVALNDCRNQWSAARTDNDRQKVRARFETDTPAPPKSNAPVTTDSVFR